MIRRLEKPARQAPTDQPLASVFGTAFDALPYPVVVTDNQRIIQMFNPAVVKVFGYQHDALIGRPVSLLYESTTDFDAQGRNRFDAGTPDNYGPVAVSYKRASGEVFLGETVGRVVRDAGGEAVAFVGIISDISERQSEKTEVHNARFALDHMDDAIFWCTPDGKFSYVNRAASRRLGYSREELLKLSITDIDPAIDVHEWANQLDNLGAEGSAVVETVHVHRSGTEIPVEVSAKLLRHGGQTSIFAFARDIRLRKESELALRRSEENIRLITDSIPVFIARVDRDFRYTFVNKSYELLFGRDRADIVGRPMDEILGVAEFQHIEGFVRRALSGETVGFERVLPNTAQGSRHIRATFLPDTQAGGGVSGIFIFARDVTEAREAAQARNESEQRASHARAQLLDAIENLPVGFTLYDADQRLVICNSMFRSMYPSVADKAKPGVCFDDIIREYALGIPSVRDDAEALEDYVRDRNERLVKADTEYEVRSIQGRYIRINNHATSDGGRVSVFSDLTEMRENEDNLRAAKEEADLASRSKTDFLATMSHELRTPLNAIIGFSDIIENEMLGPVGTSRYREYADDIRQSGRHLLEVINDILDIAKVEAGKVELDDDEVEISEIVETCYRLVTPHANEKHLKLARDIEPNVPRVAGDRRRLTQVLLNLLSNAVKFTPAGGGITTAARVLPDGRLTINVTDTGIGIPAADLERILEPFFQSDAALSRRYEGTGLGLALCKAFIKLHGGEIKIESEPKVGSTVSMLLPKERVMGARG